MHDKRAEEQKLQQQQQQHQTAALQLTDYVMSNRPPFTGPVDCSIPHLTPQHSALIVPAHLAPEKDLAAILQQQQQQLNGPRHVSAVAATTAGLFLLYSLWLM